MTDDDSERSLDRLLTRSGRGDQQAFGELYDAVAPQLLAIARRILNDHHQAEDVLQQTMIAAWNGAAGFDASRARAATWLTSITRYRAIDLLRQRGRQQTVLQHRHRDIGTALGHGAEIAATDPVSDRLARRLEVCFGRISADQAACIQLAYLDGLTLAEVSDRLERSLGTVKSWVRRGLEKLRECVRR